MYSVRAVSSTSAVPQEVNPSLLNPNEMFYRSTLTVGGGEARGYIIIYIYLLQENHFSSDTVAAKYASAINRFPVERGAPRPRSGCTNQMLVRMCRFNVRLRVGRKHRAGIMLWIKTHGDREKSEDCSLYHDRYVLQRGCGHTRYWFMH